MGEAWNSAIAPLETEGDWRLIAPHARQIVEETCCPDLLLQQPEPQKPRHSRRRETARSSAPSTGVILPGSADPLKQIRPEAYFEALTKEVPPEKGWLNCPLPDHED